MAFRNPNEGMAKFLSSIGDMRRTWEQEEVERQREERAQQLFAKQMEEAAQRMALAKDQNERDNLAANAQRLLDPLNRQAKEQDITLGTLQIGGQRNTNRRGELELGDLESGLAPGGWKQRQREADLRAQNANISQSNAAAAAADAARRRQLAELTAIERENELRATWGREKYGDTGLTNEQALMLGVRGIPGTVNAQMLSYLARMAQNEVDPAAAAAYLQNPILAKALGLAIDPGTAAAATPGGGITPEAAAAAKAAAKGKAR